MNDRGSAAPLVLALLLAGVLLVGVVVDLGRLGSSWVETHRAARAGAEAGAGVIEPASAYEGDLRVEPKGARAAANAAARRARPHHDRVVETTTSAREVCVTVRQVFKPGPARVIGARTHVLRATACASPRSG